MVDTLQDRFEKKYTDGEMIFCEFEQGDSFYFIKSGSIKLVKIIDGKESIVDVLHAGTFFGEMAIIESGLRSASAIAVGNLTLIEFPAANFQHIILQNPNLFIRLIKTFASRIFTQQQKLRIYSYKFSMTRILAYLNSSKIAKKKDGAIQYVVNSTVEDMSKWIGVPGVECTTVLKTLAQRKLISIHADSIVILDEVMLKRTFSIYSSKEES